MTIGRGRALATVLAVAALLLASCTTTQSPPPPATMAYPSAPTDIVILTTDLQGDWGLASYREEGDRERTQAEAKVACNNPYKVTAGPNGGAMMYLADQNEPTEVFVKTASTGQVFIGPPGPAGVAQDRVVLEYEDNVMISDWLDPGAKERYGTMILVRCGVA